jgi:hypothetical protein
VLDKQFEPPAVRVITTMVGGSKLYQDIYGTHKKIIMNFYEKFRLHYSAAAGFSSVSLAALYVDVEGYSVSNGAASLHSLFRLTVPLVDTHNVGGTCARSGKNQVVACESRSPFNVSVTSI